MEMKLEPLIKILIFFSSRYFSELLNSVDWWCYFWLTHIFNIFSRFRYVNIWGAKSSREIKLPKTVQFKDQGYWKDGLALMQTLRRLLTFKSDIELCFSKHTVIHWMCFESPRCRSSLVVLRVKQDAIALRLTIFNIKEDIEKFFS